MELKRKLQNHITHRDSQYQFRDIELQQLISLIDLTSLNLQDEDRDIVALCEKAMTPLGNVAAVCVYPKFVAVAFDIIGSTTINIAAVANFPSGNESIEFATAEIHHAVVGGANEIDVVFPYQDYLIGKHEYAFDFITQCQAAAPLATFKVILETSAYPDLDDIYQISQRLMILNVDFIKTSTGKSSQGATLETAGAILLAIKESGTQTGFKASGGIRTLQEAYSYIDLAKSIMGDAWLTPNHFRIGASSLLDEILANISL